MQSKQQHVRNQNSATIELVKEVEQKNSLCKEWVQEETENKEDNNIIETKFGTVH